jgi:phosphoribosylglycinamide formyltransferase-1
MTARLRVVALISGRGSNLQAILDHAGDGDLPVEICAVISNRPQAPGLERARRAGVETVVIDHKKYSDRAGFDAALRKTIDGYRPELIVLAGFMRILSDAFVTHYEGRLLNIHPSLLPKFRGLDTHERAILTGEAEHGASVHFVTPGLDEGPVIVQASVPVYAQDDAQTLAARVLEQEHRIYPLAIRWFAEGRLKQRGNTVLLDDEVLSVPYRLESS